jgi:alpha-L-fucosidase 2
MKQLKSICIINGLSAFILLFSALALYAQVKVPERGFISSQPGETWEQGLISGNGTLGANVLSQPLDETIIFTHRHLFLPMGPPTMPPDQSARLFEIRRLIDQGLYKQATELQYELSGQEDFMYPDPFVPAFDMGIKMNSDKEISDYVRSTNFENGETLVHWSDKNGSYERRLFVSRASGMVVMQITGSKKGMLNCEIKLKRTIPSNKLTYNHVQGSLNVASTHISDVKIAAEGNFLSYKNSFAKAYPGSIHGLEGLAYVDVKGGNKETGRESIVVSGADEIFILLDIKLLYDPDKSMMAAMKQSMESSVHDYRTLLDRHAAIHGSMFNRMKLDLGGGKDHQLTTEKLFEISTSQHLNEALIEKEFDAGRYNIISCTGDLPPCLQGIWAGTYVPDWASDFTHNGNVPSAIASMLMGNTPELMLAYTSYIESIVPWMEINAKHLFGARGVVLPSRSTTNGYNNALAKSFAGGFWVAGAGWAAHFFYDYYLYTGDKKFLAEHALPFMEKVGLFFEDYLYPGPDGKYVFSPTQSPENTPGNTNSQGTFNATMDVAVAKEVFNNLIAASQELGLNKDKIAVWQKMLTKMPDYMIDENGMIKEWLTPKLTNNDAHRHSSQFYALFDGMPKEIASNPALLEAFKKSIDFKLEKHWKGKANTFMSFGIVQLGQCGASLGDTAIVYESLKHLVNRFWLSNMASMHNQKSLFNMDISGGMPAVIIKMLVASDPGTIRLLPAIPSAWPTGEIDGVLCRGQVEITHLQWTKNRIHVSLLSGKNQTITLEAKGKKMKVNLPAGKEIAQEISF